MKGHLDQEKRSVVIDAGDAAVYYTAAVTRRPTGISYGDAFYGIGARG